jgi:hypothetical protein
LSDPEFEDELIGPESLIGPNPQDSRGDLYSHERPRRTAEIANLLEWTAKWEYQPGCQFVRVSREHPKVWEGIPIGGVTEEVYEPFDTDYLLERWGGGTYKLFAIQLDPDGKSRTVERKTVTLSGLPLSFRGPDGSPMALPQSKRVEETMRNRRREDYDEDDDGGQGREGGSLSAVDLYYAAQANSQQSRAMDPEALEVLRHAQNDANEHMARTMDQQQKLNENTIASQEREVERLREQMREKEQSQNTPFNYAMQMMETRSNAEMQNMRAQLDAIRSDHNNQTQMVQSEHGRVVEGYQREMDRLREDTRIREEQIRSMVTGQFQGQIAALENRALMAETNANRNVEMARSDGDRRENQTKMLLETGFEGRFQLVNSQKERLERDLTATRKELAEFRAIAMEVKDPISQLQQMQGLVSAVQGFTGKGEPAPSPDGAPAPEDFMGKVAHYGPGFAKHFLQPILSRVDAATDVANRQMYTREQELEAVAHMHGHAPDPALVGPRPAEERRVSPGGPVPVQQPEYHTPEAPPYAEEQYTPPAQDQLHTGGPGEGVVPDGMRRLVEFLEERLENEVAAPEAASELLFGVKMGVVPQHVLSDFVERGAAESIPDVLAAASVMGAGSVSSPRGMRFCEELLQNLKGGAT